MIIPGENLIGEEGQGVEILLNELDSELVMVAAGACGLAHHCIEIAAFHANKRIQFNCPIRMFEAVNFKIADMVIKLEAARSLTYHAAKIIDAGKKVIK